MPYDLGIPGWMNERNLQVIERLAGRVRGKGHIVEIGAFCGRSAVAWASSAPTARVSCIDTWQLAFPRVGPDWHRHSHGDPSRYRGSVEDTFREMTRGHGNIVPCKGRSTDDWQLPLADIVFLDGDHHEAAVAAELRHWSQRLTPNGLLCGDDFRGEPSWRGVMLAVTNYATRSGHDLFVPAKSTVWMLFASADHMRSWWL